MKAQHDPVQDIAEIRSMMERSSKFLSLSGWAGVLAGIYALVGALVAYTVFDFNPDRIIYPTGHEGSLPNLGGVVSLAALVLVLAVGTAVFLSNKNAVERSEKLWNAATRQLLVHTAVPLVAGGLFVLVLFANGLIGLVAPVTLIFYGTALYNAGGFTYRDMKSLGLIQIVLGLLGSCFVAYGLFCWVLGFGVAQIVYGFYMYYRYEQ